MANSRLLRLDRPVELKVFDGGRGVSSVQFLRLVEDRCGLGFWSAMLDGSEMKSSAGLLRLLGLSEDAPLTFNDLRKMVHPRDKLSFAGALDSAQSGAAVEHEFTVFRSDGTARLLLNRIEAVHGAGHTPERLIGVVSDLTADRSASRFAEHSQKRYEALVRSIAAVVWTVDPDGQPTDLSEWFRLTGQDPGEATDGGWMKVIHPDDRQNVKAAWTTALTQRSIYDVDYRLLCADGTYRWFNTRAAPVLRPDGTVAEWVGVCLHITGSDRVQAASATPVQTQARPVTPGQVRAARGYLNWSVQKLADESGVSPSWLRWFEGAPHDREPRPGTLDKVRRALEEAGIVFTYDAQGKTGIQTD